jgi:hypothetical protein
VYQKAEPHGLWLNTTIWQSRIQHREKMASLQKSKNFPLPYGHDPRYSIFFEQLGSLSDLKEIGCKMI